MCFKVTITENGTLKRGIEATNTVTYLNIPRPGGGAYYAEGEGVFMAKDDPSEMATWTGQGIAHYSGRSTKTYYG
jgi:DNA-binding protein H-NS